MLAAEQLSAHASRRFPDDPGARLTVNDDVSPGKPPAGVTSTVRDRHASKTVLDMIPTALLPEGGRLYPVGRLDQDSEGLLVLTNDGAWADRVLHPRHGVEREYAIGLERELGADQVDALRAGIRLDEGRGTLGGLRAMTQIEAQRLAGEVAEAQRRAQEARIRAEEEARQRAEEEEARRAAEEEEERQRHEESIRIQAEGEEARKRGAEDAQRLAREMHDVLAHSLATV